MSNRELLILSAMDLEAKIARKALADLKLPPEFSVRFLTIGISACRLPDNFCSPSTAAIILAGFAGALRPDLKLGEIILETCPADFASHLPLRRAKIHTADQLIATPQHKAELHHQSGACAVEMEFGIIRDRLGNQNVPLIHVRSISDSSEDHVDDILMKWIDPLGRPKLMNIAAGVLARPSRIKILAGLQAAIKTASPPLAKAIRQVVESLIQQTDLTTDKHR
ncbi:MAG TPA: hypothetical protein VGG19_05720 [Tepidisphaeraceae bacterium]|jgi:hypothetical protein